MTESHGFRPAAGTAQAQDRTQPEPHLCGPARLLLVALGWVNVGLGLLGLFLPLVPTTVFLLIALWLFSKSSQRFHHWLYTHPRLGRTLRAWHARRAIPRSAKVAALCLMSLSWLLVAVVAAENWVLPLALGLVLGPLGVFIASRPGVPAQSSDSP